MKKPKTGILDTAYIVRVLWETNQRILSKVNKKKLERLRDKLHEADIQINEYINTVEARLSIRRERHGELRVTSADVEHARFLGELEKGLSDEVDEQIG